MPLIKPSFRDTKPGWYAFHRGHVNSIIRQQAEVALIGDSLVANLSRYPAVWDRHLKPLNAVNCGIGGDRTQHALVAGGSHVSACHGLCGSYPLRYKQSGLQCISTN